MIFAKTGPGFGQPEMAGIGDILAGAIVVLLVVALFVVVLGGVDRLLGRLFGDS